MLAMLAKLGHNTAFIGKVGNDFFGEQLRAAIKEVGIDDTGLCTDEKIHTTLYGTHIPMERQDSLFTVIQVQT